MIQQYDSSLLPIQTNQKLQDLEGIVKSISNQQYQKILSKARTLKPLQQLLNRTSSHSEFGIIQFLETLLRLYLTSNNVAKRKKSSPGQRFPEMTADQQQIMTTLQQILELEFNPQILIKRIRISQLHTNLLFILFTTLYNSYISHNQDSTRLLEWMGIFYDGSFLKVILDQRIKKTLQIVEDILSQQLNGQKDQTQVLTMMQQVTENVEYYSEDCEKKQIETMYIGF